MLTYKAVFTAFTHTRWLTPLFMINMGNTKVILAVCLPAKKICRTMRRYDTIVYTGVYLDISVHHFPLQSHSLSLFFLSSGFCNNYLVFVKLQLIIVVAFFNWWVIRNCSPGVAAKWLTIPSVFWRGEWWNITLSLYTTHITTVKIAPVPVK